MTRHLGRADLDDTTQAILDCWLIYHGVNMATARNVELTGYGYLVVSYHGQPYDVAVTIELEPPL